MATMVSKSPTGGFTGTAERPKVRVGREKRISSITIDVSDNGGCTVRTSYRAKPTTAKKGGPELSSYVEPETYTYTSPEEAIDHITSALIGGAPMTEGAEGAGAGAIKKALGAAAGDVEAAEDDLGEDLDLDNEDEE